MGWNLENNYNQITLNKDDVIKLDEGLNSHWKILLNMICSALWLIINNSFIVVSFIL